MFPKRFWPVRFFPGRFWPKVGSDEAPAPDNTLPSRIIDVGPDVRVINTGANARLVSVGPDVRIIDVEGER